MGERADIATIHSAITSRWPISEELKAHIVETIVSIVRDSKYARNKIAAARVLLDIDRINLEQEKREQPESKRVELTGKEGGPITMQSEKRHTIEPEVLRAVAEDFMRAGMLDLPTDIGLQPGDAEDEAQP
jgi:hypothetical protein